MTFSLDDHDETSHQKIWQLINLLRNRADWPPGFEWNYDCPARCAMAFLNTLWKFDTVRPSLAAKFLGMSPEKGDMIFWNLNETHCVHRSAVTPEQVADALEEYLTSNSG